MPHPVPALRMLPLAALSLILGLSAGTLRAAEHAAPAKAPAKEAADAKAAPAKALAAIDPHKLDAHKAEPHKADAHKADPGKPAAAAPMPMPEPGSLDALREKLASKLGGAVPAEAQNPRVVRVATRAPGEFEVSAARAAQRPAAHKVAAPDARSLAAAHRADKPAAGHGSVGGHAHWAYNGETGPEAWASMKPEFSKCSTGTRQSPIDIRDGIAVELDPVKFDYRASGFGVVDNGHTVQVNVGTGNSIEVLGRRYELLQFHFHRPSEERINGRQYDMVVHLVHKDLDGRLAVVAVLLDRGAAQPLIQTVWNNLPLEKGEEIPARVAIDLNHLLPAERRYFTYMGSLTTPPCSEGVLWMVMQQPVTVSPQQIEIFSRLYPMNARPLQSAAGRLIKQSN